jgi:3-oxoacyl-[acyl-carrier-protein] synthase-3
VTALNGVPAPAEVRRPGTTSLVDVAQYVPEGVYSLEDASSALNFSDREVRRYRRFFGLDEVRWDPAARQADLLVKAAGALATLAANRHRVRFVLHARTVEPVAPYSAAPLHEAVRALDLEHATAFSVSQHACASGLLAVTLAGDLLAALEDPDALALVLTGEKTYPHVAHYMPAVMLMGESSAACLVGRHHARDRAVTYVSRTYGEYNAQTTKSADTVAAFEKEYVRLLADLLHETAEQGGVRLEDLAAILPHNVNRYSWVQVCQLLGLPADLPLLETIPRLGHSFCADPFINYLRARATGRLAPGDHYMMVSAGVGATFSALLMRH